MANSVVRFERHLDNPALGLLSPGRSLHFLIEDGCRFLCDIADDASALDIQFRRGNEIIIYHGTTKLLTLSIVGTKIRAFPNNIYVKRHETEFKELSQGLINDVPNLKPLFRAFLELACKYSNAKYYRNEKEGYWQNRLCRYFGNEWTPSKEWLVIDREAVIEFGAGESEACNAFYKRITPKYHAIRTSLGETWAQGTKDFGPELDLLAVNRDHELLCIELKEPRNQGVYYGPLQASVYRDAFDGVKDEISDGIKILAKNKIKAGILPAGAEQWLPKGNFKRVRGILAICGGPPSAECLRRLKAVQLGCMDTCDSVVMVTNHPQPIISPL